MSTVTTGPIADLSYRGYDGPLASPRLRWWAIARMSMRLAFKKKGLWVAMAASSWYYMILMVMIFFNEQAIAMARASRAERSLNLLTNINWKDQFVNGFSFGQMLFLIMTLLIGSGCIANDNRSNALLVYLSKPCTKLDYVIGKWIGIFLPLLILMAIPTFLVYGYGAMSYSEYGFLSKDPWIFLKLAALLPLCAAFHASLMLGVSSLFNQGRLAGAAYAGLYFVLNFFTQLFAVSFQMSRGEAPPIVSKLFYASVDGLNIGLAKGIFGTDLTTIFVFPNAGNRPVPAPNAFVIIAIMAVISFLFLSLAWRRIRAVEVIG